MSTNDKGIDGVLGTRTGGSRMESTDESTELWRHLRGEHLDLAISIGLFWPTLSYSLNQSLLWRWLS